MPTGTETVLLVEDEDGVRELLEEILTAQGYRVLAASRGVEALQISELLDEEIQVLVTDVVMPHMSGHELAMRLRARRPALRVLVSVRLHGRRDRAPRHRRSGRVVPAETFYPRRAGDQSAGGACAEVGSLTVDWDTSTVMAVGNMNLMLVMPHNGGAHTRREPTSQTERCGAEPHGNAERGDWGPRERPSRGVAASCP